MRRFQLLRHTDVSGISGTGIIVEGVEFTDGWVAFHWLSSVPSTTLFPNIEEVIRIHGHDGATELVWLDQKDNDTCHQVNEALRIGLRESRE